MRPMNFLICCEDGHISDFPWFAWVHRNNDSTCKDNELHLESTAIPGVAGIIIKCTS